MNEDFLRKKLEGRIEQNAFRQLRLATGKVDFFSNDYLGIAKNHLIAEKLAGGNQLSAQLNHGSTGSRLLSGNYDLIEETEKYIAAFHDGESGLIFNSGYDANTGVLSCVPQRGDTILYDQLSHASIRDGTRLSFAQSFSFDHNNVHDLENKLKIATGNIFVVTETIFSMDGDMAPMPEVVSLCEKYNAALIVDEAHATGVMGKKGEGVMQILGLQKKCFARIHTFGKAVGCHGAIVLGSEMLRNFLINFSRQFIYTTALPEVSVAAIKSAYEIFPGLIEERNHLTRLINFFQKEITKQVYPDTNIKSLASYTPIQAIVVPGNNNARALSKKLSDANFDVRAILYPTVPQGKERLRIVLHSFNNIEQIQGLAQCLFS